MQHYLKILSHIIENGHEKTDRTGVGTISVFGYQSRINLQEGFPLLTTKRVHWKSVVHELLWFIKGDTNIRPLLENGVTIWSDWPHRSYVLATGDNIGIKEFEARILSDTEFAEKWGELGPVYGKQWRRWQGADNKSYDQLAEVVRLLRNQPDSRRIILNAWKVDEVADMALPPCHLLVQFGVSNGKLHCHLYQRSADAFLGVPFNIASYALLTHMLAQVCQLEVGDFIHSYGDLHIYRNHLEQVREQMTRTPRPLPKLALNHSIQNIEDFKASDIELLGYNPMPSIKAPVAV